MSIIAKNFEELTGYIEDPRLDANNNRCETLLRGEKILIVSSKFRKSELGRVSLDILRSLIMTAKAAAVSPRSYLTWVLSHTDSEIENAPHRFTPLAFATQMQLAASESKANGA